MTEDIKRYLQQNKELIIKGNWEEFFKDEAYPNGIGEVLYLANIHFMEHVKKVPAGAFYKCGDLTDIEIPNGVTSIGGWAFTYCDSLKFVTIPEGVTYIGDDAFYGCSSLTSIKLPSTVTTIKNLAFGSCTNLTNITIPSSVTVIGDWAFDSIPTDLNITYDGTKEEWKQIYNSKAFKNTYYTVNCVDGKIVKRRKK